MEVDKKCGGDLTVGFLIRLQSGIEKLDNFYLEFPNENNDREVYLGLNELAFLKGIFKEMPGGNCHYNFLLRRFQCVINLEEGKSTALFRINSE